MYFPLTSWATLIINELPDAYYLKHIESENQVEVHSCYESEGVKEKSLDCMTVAIVSESDLSNFVSELEEEASRDDILNKFILIGFVLLAIVLAVFIGGFAFLLAWGGLLGPFGQTAAFWLAGIVSLGGMTYFTPQNFLDSNENLKNGILIGTIDNDDIAPLELFTEFVNTYGIRKENVADTPVKVLRKP